MYKIDKKTELEKKKKNGIKVDKKDEAKCLFKKSNRKLVTSKDSYIFAIKL